MSTLTSTFVAVTSLRAGDMVRYGGTDYRVAEVMPVAVLSGHVVVGYSYTDGLRDDRAALVYAVDGALAERLGGES
ncbi:hypothetical protein Rhe02_54150 [Rhizocola hellebori]|uniref:Uncharacterized protein n=1 Tax=Rhizocola hellebori TaxID=1392758 RepID=A0A8J3VIW3_9ACTN|nr:hypothetical protein [Rhizocola hellebori]GIH07348.1 hypothetical protein Rhe02_54150 [Rhizocola hellebori]